ncbi:MAG: RDD family protein [Planctomycetota bacterium]
MENLPGYDQSKGASPESVEMVRCEVTNDLVPADETVVLQGKRVSARGKQILLERLSTGQAVDGEFEAPTSLRRFGCAFLDGLLIGLMGLVIGAAMGAAAGITNSLNARVYGGIEFLAGMIGFSYFVIMHASRGQTVGKMAGKIKVVNLDGSDITFGTSMMRGFMYNGIQTIPSLLVVIFGSAFFGDFETIAPYDILGVLIGVYVLANCITVLVTRHKRAIHDMAGGTRVIMLDT